MWLTTNSASSRSVSPSNRTIGSPSPSSVNSRFGPPLGVLLDDRVGGGQDVAGGAVVALQLHHPRARVVGLEVEDVADVGAAPAVDRLVLVADDGDAVRAPRQQAHQPVLHAVGVLELVDQHVIEALRDLLGGRRPAGDELQHRQQQAAEVGRVRRRQPLLVQAVGLADDVVEVVVRHEVGPAQPRVLGAIDRGQHLTHREHPLRHLEIDQHTREQPLLIVVVVDDEVLAQADGLAPLAQDARAGGVERADPQAARADPHPIPQQLVDALAQLAGGLVGEGDRQDAARVGAGRDQARHAVGDDARLARAGARDDQQRPGRVHDRVDLGRVQLTLEPCSLRRLPPAGSIQRYCGIRVPACLPL